MPYPFHILENQKLPARAQDVETFIRHALGQHGYIVERSNLDETSKRFRLDFWQRHVGLDRYMNDGEVAKIYWGGAEIIEWSDSTEIVRMWATTPEDWYVGQFALDKDKVMEKRFGWLEELSNEIRGQFKIRADTDQEDRKFENQADLVIVTALEKEAKAVVKLLDDPLIQRDEEKDIRTYYIGAIPIQNKNRAYHVAVVLLPTTGELPAATAVIDAINRWNPRFVFMLGIAGGIRQDDLEMGDVVVADQIVGYDYGKVTSQAITWRDRVYSTSALLLERVRNFWDEKWAQRIQTPRPQNATRTTSKRFIGPIASGNKIIASIEFQKGLLERWPKLIAVETESEGVFSAIYDRPSKPEAMVVRGISDMADERKSDEWQEYAADVAATYLIEFLKSGPL